MCNLSNINHVSKRAIKITSILLVLLVIKLVFYFFSDKTERRTIAFCEEFSFQKKLNISEKFITDFDSYYTINYSLEHIDLYDYLDSIQPTKISIEILHNNEPLEIFDGNKFLSEAEAEYQLNLKFVNANSKPNTFRICIQTEMPEPSYELMFEKEFKWLAWVIISLLILITIVLGYFGFQKTSR